MITEAQLRNVLAMALSVPVADIKSDASIDTIEVWDSLKQLQIVLALEEAFDVSFAEDEALDITSLDLIRDALGRHNVQVGA